MRERVAPHPHLSFLTPLNSFLARYGLHLERSAIHGNHLNRGTRRKIRPTDQPLAIANQRFAATIDDRFNKHISTADHLLATSVQPFAPRLTTLQAWS